LSPYPVIETLAWAVAGLVAVVTALGRAAERFIGPGLWSSLLPFAAVVLALAIASAALVALWRPLRRALARRVVGSPAVVAVAAAGAAVWFAMQPAFEFALSNLRVLVGGPAVAERMLVAHQVYAAYRRADLVGLARMFERARRFEALVREAAITFDVDGDVLMGLAAAESSFVPRTSGDGGRGLFQITMPPAGAVAAATQPLHVEQLDLHDHRHNAFVAAATLRHYLDEMGGDLFLGLLAYNIGPHNGGLRAIMATYGARDFATIQPYLQRLPRDYPIRVLSAALAYRLWQRDGTLPRYEHGDNAERIQRIGIPGLDALPTTALRRGRAENVREQR
jgi:soluble lytic murein transglycosylase-like protein